ncbi:MAG TPA: hypothetical protein VES95_02590 [Dermatophilaceae bacterium]|nr:hypothetical protein [Dermatophilaceae bacterium]
MSEQPPPQGAPTPGPEPAPVPPPAGGPGIPGGTRGLVTVLVAALVGLALVTALGLTAVALAVNRFADTGTGWVDDRGPMMGGDGRWGDDGDDQGPAPGKGNGSGPGRGNGNGNGNALPPVGALHGEYTATVGGATVPMLFQTGAVTRVDGATSLTVRSTDGFTATYTRDADTVVKDRGRGLAVGGTVTVLARKEGAAAVHVWLHRAQPGPAPSSSATPTP